MIKSMTGYGGAKGSVEGLSISVELKSVNNRYLDVSVKLPRSFLFAEELIKSAVGRHISRGKVDVFVAVDASASDDMVVRVNEPLLRGYIDALGAVSEKYGLENDMTLMGICRLPDVLSTDRRELDNSALAEGLNAILETALTEYDAMRLREGEKLRDDVVVQAGRDIPPDRNSGAGVAQDRRGIPRAAGAEAPGGARLHQHRREPHPDRVPPSSRTSVAVDEETVRLRSHVSQLRGLAEGDSPAGRKMDFLIQELNRESNTIGSKCQNADIAHVVVDLKAEIEKIREQIQNVE